MKNVNTSNSEVNTPIYPIAIQRHAVFKSAPELFNKPLDPWDFAEGGKFLEMVNNYGLKMENVNIYDAGKRGKEGQATRVEVKTLRYDVANNMVIFVDKDDNQRQFTIGRYRISDTYLIPDGEGIKMDITTTRGSDEGQDLYAIFKLVKPKITLFQQIKRRLVNK